MTESILNGKLPPDAELKLALIDIDHLEQAFAKGSTDARPQVYGSLLRAARRALEQEARREELQRKADSMTTEEQERATKRLLSFVFSPDELESMLLSRAVLPDEIDEDPLSFDMQGLRAMADSALASVGLSAEAEAWEELCRYCVSTEDRVIVPLGSEPPGLAIGNGSDAPVDGLEGCGATFGIAARDLADQVRRKLHCGPEPGCDHGITFDAAAARKLLDEWEGPKSAAAFIVGNPASAEVRKRWPRLHGECPKGCGYSGIYYASYEHYICGDW